MIDDPLLLVLPGVFGLVLGSFLNVCIVRLPEDQSVVTPRSRCPQCGRSIPWFDNVPVVSWLVLRARCRSCAAPISVLYPIVEIAVAAIWVGAVALYGWAFEAVAGGLFGTLLLGIAVTDARTYLIPDEYTFGGLAVGLLLALAGGAPGLLTAGLGAAVGFGLLWVVAWAGERAFGEEAMGGGDIKMMAMVGSFVGWQGVLITVFGGALLGTLIFVPLSFGKRRKVPFGVFLAAAAAVTFVLGDRIMDWYLDYVIG